MDLFKKNNGAVTVFLVIILVPCIVVASCFVDLSRLWLASGVSSTSADLALNSVTTNYDAELKKLYGLMASAQDVSDACDKAEEYYQQLLTSQGLSSDEAGSTAGNMADLIRASVGGESSGDSGGSLNIAPVKGANLANATLVRNQIVEFMKYRAPIDITFKTIDLLTHFGDQSKTLKEAEHDKVIIDQKETYYESLEALLTKLKEIYDIINKFETRALVHTNYIEVRKFPGKCSLEYGRIYPFFILNALNVKNVPVPARYELTTPDLVDGNETIVELNNKSVTYVDDVENQISSLSTLKEKLNALPGLVATCQAKRTLWETEANNGTTDIALQDQAELAGESSDLNLKAITSLVDYISSNPDCVSLLDSRNNTVIAELEQLKKVVDTDTMFFALKHPAENGAKAFDDHKKAVGDFTWLNSYTDVYEDYYKDLDPGTFFERVYRESNYRFDGYGWYSDDYVGGVRSQNDFKFSAFSDLYDKVKEYFDDKQVDLNDAEANKNAKDELNNAATAEPQDEAVDKNIPNIKNEVDELPSVVRGLANSVNVLGGLVNLALTFADNPENALYNVRDSIYAAEYCRSMFGYYTIDTDKVNRPQPYPAVEADDSLTLERFNLNNKIAEDSHRAMYGELEYLLFGNGGDADILAAGANIYGVRLALNIPSAFINFWSPAKNTTARVINSASIAAQAATAGVVPYPVFKIVFILALAAIESGVDVYNLLRGYAVLFYKVKDTEWVCAINSGSITSALSNMQSKAGEAKTAGGVTGENLQGPEGDKKLYLYYSDYLYLFLLIGFNDTGTSEALYLRTADLIQANMSLRDASFRMAKASVYFELTAEVEVAPLMLALPLASQYTDGKDVSGWSVWKFREHVYRGYQ